MAKKGGNKKNVDEEKYIDSNNLQKRGYTKKRLEENRLLRKNGKFPNLDSGKKNEEDDS